MEKIKNINIRLLLATSIVCILPIFVGLYYYNDLPATIAIHWGFSGEANGYASKLIAIVLLPLFCTVMNFLLIYSYYNQDQKRKSSAKMAYIVVWIIPIITVICSVFTIYSGLGYDMNVQVLAPLVIGLILIVIGNYLPKVRQNGFVGVRLPWTLKNEDNWNKTNRLSGYIFVVCGLLLILQVFLTNVTPLPTIIALVIAVIVPAAYSYYLHAKRGM